MLTTFTTNIYVQDDTLSPSSSSLSEKTGTCSSISSSFSSNLIELVQRYGMFGHCIWCTRWSNVLPSFCSRMLPHSHQLCSRKRSYLEVCQEQLGALSQLATAYCSLASNPIRLAASDSQSIPEQLGTFCKNVA